MKMSPRSESPDLESHSAASNENLLKEYARPWRKESDFYRSVSKRGHTLSSLVRKRPFWQIAICAMLINLALLAIM